MAFSFSDIFCEPLLLTLEDLLLTSISLSLEKKNLFSVEIEFPQPHFWTLQSPVVPLFPPSKGRDDLAQILSGELHRVLEERKTSLLQQPSAHAYATVNSSTVCWTNSSTLQGKKKKKKK